MNSDSLSSLLIRKTPGTPALKFFFVSYCFDLPGRERLIGVYKRALRISLKLADRGHEIHMFCTGRGSYQDALTRQAERRLKYLELDDYRSTAHLRRRLNRAFSRIKPDVVVIGEAPLSGPLLIASQCAVEHGIRLVLLDNAYSGFFAENICDDHGPLFDGLILAGPTSFHTQNPKPYLCQIPPYVESSPQRARVLLRRLGLGEAPLITILGYDRKTGATGLAILEKLEKTPFSAVLIASQDGFYVDRVNKLPPSVRKRVALINAPRDPLLFGLIELSRLAVVKYGFMQLSECLSLHSPTILVYHDGLRWLGFLPKACRPFIHETDNPDADRPTIAAATRFLRMDPSEMIAVHGAGLQAAHQAAGFLENLPPGLRQETRDETMRLGFTEGAVVTALQQLCQHHKITLENLRSTLLRRVPDDFEVFSLLCRYTRSGVTRQARLWGRRYHSSGSANRDFARASHFPSWRRILYFSSRARLMIETDAGESLLPPLP